MRQGQSQKKRCLKQRSEWLQVNTVKTAAVSDFCRPEEVQIVAVAREDYMGVTFVPLITP